MGSQPSGPPVNPFPPTFPRPVNADQDAPLPEFEDVPNDDSDSN